MRSSLAPFYLFLLCRSSLVYHSFSSPTFHFSHLRIFLHVLSIKGHTTPSSKQEKIPIAILSGGSPLPADVLALMITLPCPKSNPTVLIHLPWLLTRIPSSAQVPSNSAAHQLRPSLGRISVDVSVTHRPLHTLMHGTRKKIIPP